MIVVLWGVSGCGKSTIGKRVAAALECQFFDADDYHPAANVAKMSAGQALTDADRAPWLARLADLMQGVLRANETAVFACSALRHTYRERLTIDSSRVCFIQLAGSFDVIEARLNERDHEFMPVSLLRSQFATLEPEPGGMSVNIDVTPDRVCERILALLQSR